MCLTIRSKFPNAFMADKDIICYKVLMSDMESPFMYFKYKRGKVYTTELEVIESTCKPHMNTKTVKTVHAGFHSYSFFYKESGDNYFYKAIIPKVE